MAWLRMIVVMREFIAYVISGICVCSPSACPTTTDLYQAMRFDTPSQPINGLLILHVRSM